MRRGFLAAALLAALVLVIAGCGGGGSTGSSGGEGNSVTQQPSAPSSTMSSSVTQQPSAPPSTAASQLSAPPSTAASRLGVGESVTVNTGGGEWTATLVEVKDLGFVIDEGNGFLVTADQDATFYAADFELTNQSGSPWSGDPEQFFVAYDTGGSAADLIAWSTLPDDLPPLKNDVRLEDGMTASGWMLFQMPKGTTPPTLVFRDPETGAELGVWQP